MKLRLVRATAMLRMMKPLLRKKKLQLLMRYASALLFLFSGQNPIHMEEMHGVFM